MQVGKGEEGVEEEEAGARMCWAERSRDERVRCAIGDGGGARLAGARPGRVSWELAAGRGEEGRGWRGRALAAREARGELGGERRGGPGRARTRRCGSRRCNGKEAEEMV